MSHDPYPIFGKIYDSNGNPKPNTPITVRNDTKNEEQTTTTNQYGEYERDLGNFPSGWDNNDLIVCSIPPKYIENTSIASGMPVYYTFPRGGQKLYINARVYRIDFNLWKNGTPSGTGYATIRKVNNDALIEQSSTTIDVSTLSDSGAWYSFTFSSIVNEEVYILFEYNGGDGNNYVAMGYSSTDTIEGVRVRYYGTGYDVYDGTDIAIKIYLSSCQRSTTVDVTNYPDGREVFLYVGPYPIFGVVYRDGVIQTNTPVTVKNETTGDQQITTTNNYGEYVVDLGNLTNCWNNNDVIKITCSGIDAVRRVNIAEFPAGRDVPIYLSWRDITSLLDSKKSVISKFCSGILNIISSLTGSTITGSHDPYPIFGRVYRDGVIQTGISITIRNDSKGEEETVTTNEYGEYVVDLGNLPSGWNEGDIIKITCNGTTNIRKLNTALFPDGREVPVHLSWRDVLSPLDSTLIIRKLFSRIYTEIARIIDSILIPEGRSHNPYPIFGKVYRGGIPQPDISVVVRNDTKAEEESVFTNQYGEYVVDLGNLASGWMSNDIIKCTCEGTIRKFNLNPILYPDGREIILIRDTVEALSLIPLIKKSTVRMFSDISSLTDAIKKSIYAVKNDVIELRASIVKALSIIKIEVGISLDSVMISRFIGILSETINLIDSAIKNINISKIDLVTFIDSMMRIKHILRTYADNIKLFDTISRIKSIIITLTDSITQFDLINIIYIRIFTKELFDALKIIDIYSRGTWNAYKAYIENINILDTINKSIIIKAIIRTIALIDITSGTRVKLGLFIEAIKLSDIKTFIKSIIEMTIRHKAKPYRLKIAQYKYPYKLKTKIEYA